MNSDNLPPTILVIFGVTGDLSKRYLLKALARIKASDKFTDDLKILGISRRNVNVNDVLSADCNDLKSSFEVMQMDPAKRSDYDKLKDKLDDIRQSMAHEPQIIFYLVLPANTVSDVVENLGGVGLNDPSCSLMLEKPFGTDLQTAKQLVKQTKKYFSEEQVYRIDHYLAKEMAQNLVVFLGGNAMFQNIWNNQFIEKIEITASEQIGIEGRVNLWESTGTLRDFVQSHLLQLAALVLMEPCSELFNFEEVPARRLAALKDLEPVRPEKINQRVLRGQYKGYKEEVGRPDSYVETFVSLTLFSKNKRWEGVPIKLTTGKNLNERLTTIVVYFKKSHASQSNLLYYRIQPRESVELDLWIKEPGYERKLQKRPLSFVYEQHYEQLPEAYEQVLVDAVSGNRSLFTASEEVLVSWEILQPVLDAWQQDGKDLIVYEPGSAISDILAQAVNSQEQL
jgi:glucose-6-phosphate 1-dehydrogenase